jgi:hypothetical protein
MLQALKSLQNTLYFQNLYYQLDRLRAGNVRDLSENHRLRAGNVHDLSETHRPRAEYVRDLSETHRPRAGNDHDLCKNRLTNAFFSIFGSGRKRRNFIKVNPAGGRFRRAILKITSPGRRGAI